MVGLGPAEGPGAKQLTHAIFFLSVSLSIWDARTHILASSAQNGKLASSQLTRQAAGRGKGQPCAARAGVDGQSIILSMIVAYILSYIEQNTICCI